MKVTASEFIRRFLLHVLPNGFMKIRYFGICSNRSRKEKIGLCKKILHVAKKDIHDIPDKKSWQDIYFQVTGIDISICHICGKGKMRCKETISPQTWKPPGMLRVVI